MLPTAAAYEHPERVVVEAGRWFEQWGANVEGLMVLGRADADADAGARILLAHQPGSAQAAANAGYDVQISGHTHGGQFWPWNLFVRFFQPFTAGLHRVKNLWVYVSRGTGYWGPPNRFGVPAEITRIRLVPAAASA